MNVIKLGGRVLDDPQGLTTLFQHIAQQQNLEPTLIVHGGGQQVDDLFAKLNLLHARAYAVGTGSAG